MDEMKRELQRTVRQVRQDFRDKQGQRSITRKHVRVRIGRRSARRTRR